MLDHAINSLMEHIRATADMVKEYPDNEDMKQELYALISAINVLEIYEYGQHRTRYTDYIKETKKSLI